MNEEIVKMVMELVRDGGNAAIWIFAIHYIISIGKFTIGFGFLYAAVCKVCAVIKGAIEDD